MWRHTFTSATVGITHVSLAQNWIVPTPMASRKMFTMPSCVSSIHRNTMAATTLETRYGASTRERSHVDCVRRCISTAITSATTVCTPMLISTYRIVTFSEFQNTGSASIAW